MPVVACWSIRDKMDMLFGVWHCVGKGKGGNSSWTRHAARKKALWSKLAVYCFVRHSWKTQKFLSQSTHLSGFAFPSLCLSVSDVIQTASTVWTVAPGFGTSANTGRRRLLTLYRNSRSSRGKANHHSSLFCSLVAYIQYTGRQNEHGMKTGMLLFFCLAQGLHKLMQHKLGLRRQIMCRSEWYRHENWTQRKDGSWQRQWMLLSWVWVNKRPAFRASNYHLTYCKLIMKHLSRGLIFVSLKRQDEAWLALLLLVVVTKQGGTSHEHWHCNVSMHVPCHIAGHALLHC